MPSIYDIADESTPANILKKYIGKMEETTNRNVILYYSAWLNHNVSGTEINDIDKNAFMSVVHGLETDKGLDLFLHTPGGSVSATESIIDYLYEIFEGNIRAVIPQLAMSGGTMIACSCKEIIMGKQSSLGPIDPQIMGLPAQGIIGEFERAKKEIDENPSNVAVWQPILAKYHPTLISSCDHAVQWSNEILVESLKRCMFENDPKADEKIGKIKDCLGSHKNTKAHDRHINHNKCEKIGLKIKMMEENDSLQDNILSVHHACLNLMNEQPVSKVIMNNIGKAFVQQVVK